jgi:hypothetical protein
MAALIDSIRRWHILILVSNESAFSTALGAATVLLVFLEAARKSNQK